MLARQLRLAIQFSGRAHDIAQRNSTQHREPIRDSGSVHAKENRPANRKQHNDHSGY